jgi:hypothetical protein
MNDLIVVYLKYYDVELEESLLKVVDFLKHLNVDLQNVHHVYIIENDLEKFKKCGTLKCGDYSYLRGDNNLGEFTGYLAGLRYILENDCELRSHVLVLNDTYLKNWDITFASRRIIRKLYASLGTRWVFAYWSDTVFWPKLNQKFRKVPNSRFLFVHSCAIKAFEKFLSCEVRKCDSFSKDALVDEIKYRIGAKRVYAMKELLTVSQGKNNRWYKQDFHFRLKRIYLEHQLCKFAPNSSKSSPLSFLGSLVYAISRRVFREKR